MDELCVILVMNTSRPKTWDFLEVARGSLCESKTDVETKRRSVEVF